MYNCLLFVQYHSLSFVVVAINKLLSHCFILKYNTYNDNDEVLFCELCKVRFNNFLRAFEAWCLDARFPIRCYRVNIHSKRSL